MLKNISCLFLPLLSVLITACVSSRTTEHRVFTASEDSTTLSFVDSAKVVSVQKGSTSVTLTDSTHLMADVSKKDANEETITEQITENYDTNGSKTITTQRTIQRKGYYTKQTHVECSRLLQEQTLKQYVDSLNQEWSNRLNVLKKSLAKNDSINNVAEKNTANIKPQTGWRKAKQFLGMVVLFCLLVWAIGYDKKRQ